MNKKKILLGLAIVGAVGITYAITTLKSFENAFDIDWDDNE
jgi:hypothetical protein